MRGRRKHKPWPSVTIDSGSNPSKFIVVYSAILRTSSRIAEFRISSSRVNARATVTELVPEKRRATLSTVVSVAGKVVLEGEAVVLVPLRAAAAKDQAAAAPRIAAAG